MAKFWVSYVKYAGLEIEADSAEQAEAIAEDTDESQLEFDQIDGDVWQFNSVEPLED